MKTLPTLIPSLKARQRCLSVLAAVALFSTFPSHGSDRDREDRLVEEMEANLFDGKVISLMPDGDAFAAVEMESQADITRGAVILLHGRGFHADWPENIGPLRVALSEAGWHTLSLQMPVLEKSAKYFDYVPVLPEALPRIDAALAHLAAENISPVVLLAHSCGAHMAMLWMEQLADEGIDAFIGIGMGATDYQQPMRHPFPFALLKVPVLDLYGALDYPAVHRMAPERLQLINEGGNPLSKQVVSAGVDHYFTDNSDQLIEEVNGWLDSLAW
ncbi:MAG: alpha/beta fold hydrolase [Arenicellales bacterium]|jgi:alpha-beta hydrolase superfamily lysophospholipase|nr:alpha/beta fold hydrolase [Arenicellales bacterium]|tara:strand:- start:450 stop:1268 length:819 start_codon:yes stop_codon:yes gene_type:complete